MNQNIHGFKIKLKFQGCVALRAHPLKIKADVVT